METWSMHTYSHTPRQDTCKEKIEQTIETAYSEKRLKSTVKHRSKQTYTISVYDINRKSRCSIKIHTMWNRKYIKLGSRQTRGAATL